MNYLELRIYDYFVCKYWISFVLYWLNILYFYISDIMDYWIVYKINDFLLGFGFLSWYDKFFYLYYVVFGYIIIRYLYNEWNKLLIFFS